MNVSFSGTRKYASTQANIDKLNNTALVVMGNADVKSIYFGGAIGVDTEMLYRCAKYNDSKKNLIVITPNTCKELSPTAKYFVDKYATEFIELCNEITHKDAFNSFRLRNMKLVDLCDKLYAFPLKGKTIGGTWHAINYAKMIAKKQRMESKKEIEICIIELVPVIFL